MTMFYCYECKNMFSESEAHYRRAEPGDGAMFSVMVCPRCQSDQVEVSAWCEKCGEPIAPGDRWCDACKTDMSIVFEQAVESLGKEYRETFLDYIADEKF